MNKNYLENVMSKEKIFTNLKKYFWVLIVCIVVGLGISLVSIMVANQENPQTEAKDEITKTVSRNAAVKLEWGSEVVTDLDYKIRAEKIEELRYLVSTTTFMNALSEKLEAQGFEVFKEPDVIVVERISMDMLQIYVFSQSEDERVLSMLEATIEYVFNRAVDEGIIVSYEVVERGELSYPLMVTNRYYFYPLAEDEEIEEVVEDEESSKYVSAIIVVLLTLFVGVLIILLLITLDKRVYSENEITRVLDLECLGDYTNNKQNTERIKNIIGAKCKLQGCSKLNFAVCNQLENVVEVNEIVKYLESIGVSSKIVDNVVANNATLLDFVDSTVVLVVQSKKDTIDDVWEVYSNIKQIGKDVEGFIIR